jgi:hypothetical protein
MLNRVRAVIVLAAVAAAALPAVAAARPFRAHVPWSVLLCKFSDQTAEQHPPSWFSNYLTEAGRGQGGLADYFHDVSDGGIDLQGSEVKGWYPMGVTLAQSQAAGKTRWDRINDCIAAASAGGYNVPAGNRIVAIINGQVDSGSAGGRVLLDPLAWNVSFAAHEMGHGINLNHSFSDDPYYKQQYGDYGEYDDPWDLMSAMNVFTHDVPVYDNAPVGLNAEHLDRMGWQRRSEVLTFGADGSRRRTLTLTGLYQPGRGGIREVRVPFDAADPFRYYTVELRMKSGLDSGIPANVVLIHEVKRRGATPTTYLLRQRSAADRPRTPSCAASWDPACMISDRGRDPVQQVDAHGVRISVDSIDAASGTARVTIASNFADRCKQGFVWREVVRSDHVCVTPATRSRVRADNAARGSRHLSGSRTCRQGFVWREAIRGDFVCVAPSQRTQARIDNAHAHQHRNPATEVYGPNTCKPGYVWRAADQRDWVCVRSSVRSDVRADNAAADSRRQPGGGAYGPNTCRPGFVWREAFPGDFVCVGRDRRAQARADNDAASSRLMVP